MKGFSWKFVRRFIKVTVNLSLFLMDGYSGRSVLRADRLYYRRQAVKTLISTCQNAAKQAKVHMRNAAPDGACGENIP
jgi:hypothetical protein